MLLEFGDPVVVGLVAPMLPLSMRLGWRESRGSKVQPLTSTTPFITYEPKPFGDTVNFVNQMAEFALRVAVRASTSSPNRGSKHQNLLEIFHFLELPLQ